MRPARARSGVVGGLLVTVTALVLTGCASTSASRSTTSTPTGVASPAAAEPATPVETTVPGPVGAVALDVPHELQPVRISVPSIGVDASMTELGVGGDGTVEVPSDADQVGWVDTTPAPGTQGPAVLAGHVDSSSGPAVFYRLPSVAVGAAITVTRRDGSTARFTVDAVQRYAKDRFPTDQVYGPVPGPALRLITCGGAYDRSRGGYQDNVVVFAT